jgi:hypothetical protein
MVKVVVNDWFFALFLGVVGVDVAWRWFIVAGSHCFLDLQLN